MALNLGKQYGPLPLGGWVAVVIGGLGIGYFINRSQGSGTGEPESETPAGESSGAGGGQFIYEPPATGETPSNTVTDNLTWAKKAKDYLAALPGVDAVQAANAIERYLSGMSLSNAERALVNLAIAQFGNPPEGVTPVDDTPPVVKPPTTPTPTIKPRIRLTIRNHPATVRRGASAAFTGYISSTVGTVSKPLSTMLVIERRPPNSRTWLPHTLDASNSAGIWGLNTSFGSPGVWGFRVRHVASGKAAETTVRVT